jgi:hypothetical protein
MRRRLVISLLLAAASTAAACGGTYPSAEPATAPPAGEAPAAETGSGTETSAFAETGGTEPATPTEVHEPDPSPTLKPPLIVLESDAGRQKASPGTYCLTRVSEASEGEGICVDSAFQHPEELSVVQPGENVTISIVGADVVVPDGCSPADECASPVTIHPLGCGPEGSMSRFELSRHSTRWTVDLEPGAYELSVFAYFDGGGGTSGDLAGTVGLLVDPDRKPAVVPVDESLAVCPYPKQP